VPCVSLYAGGLRRRRDEDAQLRVESLDARQVRVRHFPARDIALLDEAPQIEGGQLVQRPHHSTILGTMKNSSVAAGASRRNCSRASEGRTSSSRKTFASGTAWLVGGTPSVSSSWSRPKCSMIAFRS